jgi:mRNA-degrading endonuclease RelE of RelBE toxin-antitoxin system
MRARSYGFDVDDEIEKDIEDCFETHPEQAALLVALLDEIQGDRIFCESLVDIHSSDDPIESVAYFARLQGDRYNAYRVRVREIHDWRLITAVDHTQRRIALLYIMRRDENYDATVQRRCIAAYERLGLKRLGQ